MKSPLEQIISEVTLFDYLTQELNYSITLNQLPMNVSCPLHTDRKPSMRLYNPAENNGYCFSCGKAYNSFTIHQQLHNLSYIETSRELSKLFNIEITYKKNPTRQQNSQLFDKKVSECNIKAIQHIKNNPSKIAKNFSILEKRMFRAFKDNNPSAVWSKE